MSRRILTAFAFAATLVLTACESSEEKADAFYKSGMELLAAGDPDRAIVAFRNVFRFDGEHYEARKELADALAANGDLSGAYSQYLRLAEQYPDDVVVLQTLAQMAIRNQGWDEAERHGRRALELAPDATEINDPIRVSLGFRQSILDEDDAKTAQFADEAQALLDINPTDILSRRIVIAHALQQDRPGAVLEAVEPAIVQFPEDISYYTLKLRALSTLQDTDALEAHLRVMYTQFPENEDVQRTLIGFYLQRQDFDGAETFLRQLAGEETDDPAGFVSVIQLIEQAKGRDAAKAEMQRLADVNAEYPENADFYKALLASYAFEDGDRDGAIADLQALITDAEPSDQIRRIKGTLANMLLRTDNQVGARALAEEVLAEDQSNVVALKLRAQLLINADQPSEAIGDLRRALDQSPRDLDTLLLLAAAHERNGNTELQGERLAIAVEVSNSAPRESLLYANYLLRNERTEAARSVLDDARNAHPRNVDILVQSARLALQEESLGVVRGVIADLERIPEDERAAEVATSLRSALLLQEDRAEEGLELLQEQAGGNGQNTSAVYAVIQTQLRSGKLEEARAYLDSVMVNAPNDINLRLINAALHVAEGDPATSEAILRELITANPAQQTAVSQLYVQLRRTRQVDEARVVLNAGLAANPDAARLLQYQAGELEALGDIEGAIAVYEKLYERNTSNVTIANNLASLISTFRDTPESLERAGAVARRLRGTEVPAFQDTYGWIAYRQGDFADAVNYLEPAAKGLPNNALVQFHLGMTYVALERPDEAKPQLERALELAGPDSTLTQMQIARDTLNTLNGQ
ncbi:MAG: tetratricopeptide repeat protein [Aliishimia sp.]